MTPQEGMTVLDPPPTGLVRCGVRPSGNIASDRRRRQVVRQRSAKPPSPVQIRAAPPILERRGLWPLLLAPLRSRFVGCSIPLASDWKGCPACPMGPLQIPYLAARAVVRPTLTRSCLTTSLRRSLAAVGAYLVAQYS